MMEEQVKHKRKKMVVSFSGCSKSDTGDGKKDNAADRVNTHKGVYGMRRYGDHTDQSSSQSYKFY